MVAPALIRPFNTDPIDELRRRILGEVLTPDSDGYNAARRIYNVAIDRHPAVIVRALHAYDVVEAVRFANAQQLPLAVRGGGHSLAGHSVIEGAVVVDMSLMKNVNIDPVRQTARVQAGATSGDLAGPAHAYGLALSTGDTSTVGISGLTLGGGIGWMVRKYGLAIDNLLSVQLVTADGRYITASAEQHPDLFWALRGGGGNFGIVTELEFRLAPVGSIVGGLLVLPATREVLRAYLDYAPTAPEGLSTIGQVMQAPPAPFIPEALVGTPVFFLLVAWSGDEDEGQRAIAPLRAQAEPIADLVSQIPYPVMFTFTQEANTPHASVIRAMYSDELDDASIDAVLAGMQNAPSPVSMVQFRGLGGAMSRVPKEATAFAHRDARLMVTVLGMWPDPAEDRAPYESWVGGLWNQLRAQSRGVYVNFLSDEGESRVREAYSEAHLARLAEVKRRYDPTNVFKFNQNIRPKV